jgi:hypothetical protein
MKRFITILLITLFSLFFISSNNPITIPDEIEVQQSNLYKNLGTFTNPYNSTTVVIVDIYVTKEINNTGQFSQYKYLFKLMMVSRSRNVNALTSTWLYNTKVFVNDTEVTFNQNPYGFTGYVRTTPTNMYSWFTNDVDVKYGINWNDSTYDPRNLK